MLSLDSSFSDSTTTNWLPYAKTVSFPVPSGLHGGNLTIYVKYMDAQGSVSSTYDLVVAAPSGAQLGGSAAVAGSGSAQPGYTNNPSITLNVSTTATQAPIAQMMFSEDQTFANAAWVPYAATYQFNLSAGDGLKTVWAKFKDSLGNVSTPASTVITLLTATPPAPVLGAGNQQKMVRCPNSQTVSVSACDAVYSEPVTFSTDVSNYPYFYTYEVLGGQYATWTPVSSPFVFTLGSSNWHSFVAFQVRMRDLAGNVSTVATEGIVYDSWAMFSVLADGSVVLAETMASDPITKAAAKKVVSDAHGTHFYSGFVYAYADHWDGFQPAPSYVSDPPSYTVRLTGPVVFDTYPPPPATGQQITLVYFGPYSNVMFDSQASVTYNGPSGWGSFFVQGYGSFWVQFNYAN